MSVRDIFGRTTTLYNNPNALKLQEIIKKQKQEKENIKKQKYDKLESCIKELYDIADIDGFEEGRKKKIKKYPQEKLLLYFPKFKQQISSCYDESGNIKQDCKDNLEDIIVQAIFDEIKVYYEQGFEIDKRKFEEQKFKHEIVLKKQPSSEKHSCKNRDTIAYTFSSYDKTIKENIDFFQRLAVKKTIRYDGGKNIISIYDGADSNEPLLSIDGEHIKIYGTWKSTTGFSDGTLYVSSCKNEDDKKQLQDIFNYLRDASLDNISKFCSNLKKNFQPISATKTNSFETKVDTNIMLDVLLKTKEGKKNLPDDNDDNRRINELRYTSNEMPNTTLPSSMEQNNGCPCNCWW